MLAVHSLDNTYVLRVQVRRRSDIYYLPKSIKNRQNCVAACSGGPELKQMFKQLQDRPYIAHVMLICLGSGEISCYSSNQ